MTACVYAIQHEDGYETRWATSCGHTVVCEAPEEVGFSFAPLPTDDGQKFCSWCGGTVQLDKKERQS
jgi:hypothetical protein